jgi:2-methylcitrate dehydratase PrpD
MSDSSASPTSLTEQLSRHLVRPVDAAARARACLAVLDWAGCAVIGAATDTGRAFARLAAGGGAGAPGGVAGPSRVLGAGRVPVRDAAFINGAYGNIYEMDDVDRQAVLHPGPVVIPAALAMAEALGSGPDALLDAVVRGYEAMVRLGRAMGPAHYRQFHPTATCGAFGAAAAATSLMGLDQAGLAGALGTAATRAAGLWQCRHEPVTTKQFHTARAAAGGIEAAQLAAIGLGGPRFILEGPQGLFAGMAPDARPAEITAPHDGAWLILGTSIKPWPACRHAHAAIDAALILRAEAQGRMPAAIQVRTFADALTFCDRPDPGSTIQAKFSLQHAVAVTLLGGPPPLAAFEPEVIADPVVARLRAMVTPVVAEPYAGAYPRRFGTGLTITWDDGTTSRAEVPDALGDPENPVDDATVVAKTRTLARAAGLDEQRIGALIQAIEALEGSDPARIAAVTAILP